MSALLYCIFLGIIEGITEFLPISSTGHLFLVTNWLGPLKDTDFTQTFNIFIQIGAIAAVVVYFRRRIRELLLGPPVRAKTPLEISSSARVADPSAPAMVVPTQLTEQIVATPAQRRHVLLMILIATVPVLIVGWRTNKWVETHLEGSPTAIALALIIGGVLIALIEWLPTNVTTKRMESITLPQAIGIGVAQIFAAVFPGTSRSAATIMGGMLAGLSRAAATEFSFFLAIPAMAAACGYKLYQYLRQHPHVSVEDLLLLAIGTFVSFVVAWIVIAGFMGYIRRHNFIPFAVYRIALGIIVLLFFRRAIS